MRRRSWWTLALGALALAGATIETPAAPAWAAAAAAQVTVKGEVVDSNCYIRGGSKGESHRGCAQACADAGVPLALLEDGSNKVIWLASKKDMESPNTELKQYAGRKVTIKGTYAERGGARILVIDSVEPAK
jgi:hypothetical protein